MGFWGYALSISLLLIWVVAGGYITDCCRNVDPYKKENSSYKLAFDCSLAATIITWVLCFVGLYAIGAAIAGVIVLFGTGVGEVGAAGAGGVAVVGEGAAALEGGAAAEEGVAAERALMRGERTAVKQEGKLANKARSRSGKKKKRSKLDFSKAFVAIAIILLLISGVLSAVTFTEVDKSDKTDYKIKKAKNDSFTATLLCLCSAGLVILGFIIYEVHKKRQEKAQQQEQEEEKQAQLVQNQYSAGMMGGFGGLGSMLGAGLGAIPWGYYLPS